jgi:hypothetical protein
MSARKSPGQAGADSGRSSRTTMRYGRARNNPDRHPDYILAVYMASGT